MLSFQNIHREKKIRGEKNQSESALCNNTLCRRVLSGDMRYRAGLQRFNKSPFAVIPAGWESSMTERHTASPLPHSKATELQNDPTMHWCLRHSPMCLAFPTDHLWLEHCCKPSAQGWSVRPSWKVKVGRNNQTVSQEKVPPTSPGSLSLSPLHLPHHWGRRTLVSRRRKKQ